MKNLQQALLVCALCIGTFSTAQVGIGTTSPNSLLDIQVADASDPSNKDGIIIPRIDTFPSTDPGSDQNGMLIFLTTAVGSNASGFYYWDYTNTKWIGFSGEWKDGTNESGDPIIFASQAGTAGVDIAIRDDGWLGIGTDDPIERVEIKSPGDNDLQLSSANTNPPNVIFYNTGGTLENPGLTAPNQELGSFIVKTHDGTRITEPGGFRFYIDGTPTTGSTPSRLVVSTTPEGSISQQERMTIDNDGKMGVGIDDPTATLHLRAGTASVGGAPIKLESGTLLTTPENGAVEFDGNDLYVTENSTRQILLKGYKNSSNLNFGTISAGGTAELTMTVAGANVGDTCSGTPASGIESYLVWSCYVSAPNTVTVRVCNTSSSSQNPSSRGWNVSVIHF